MQKIYCEILIFKDSRHNYLPVLPAPLYQRSLALHWKHIFFTLIDMYIFLYFFCFNLNPLLELLASKMIVQLYVLRTELNRSDDLKSKTNLRLTSMIVMNFLDSWNLSMEAIKLGFEVPKSHKQHQAMVFWVYTFHL